MVFKAHKMLKSKKRLYFFPKKFSLFKKEKLAKSMKPVNRYMFLKTLALSDDLFAYLYTYFFPYRL